MEDYILLILLPIFVAVLICAKMGAAILILQFFTQSKCFLYSIYENEKLVFSTLSRLEAEELRDFLSLSSHLVRMEIIGINRW